MIVEMRTYTTKPGLRQAFLTSFFRAKTMPEHEWLGMKIVGPFASVEHADRILFMRFFTDLATRENLKQSVYEGPLWKHELEALLMPMLDHDDVFVIDDVGVLAPLFGAATI